MTDHRDEGPIDRIKDGLGMDTDDERRTDTDEALDSDRTSGWAGVDDALGGSHNRSAGPDYGARDTTDGDLDADTDTTATRTGEDDQ